MMNARGKIYQLEGGKQRPKTLIDPQPAIFIIVPSKVSGKRKAVSKRGLTPNAYCFTLYFVLSKVTVP